jgi:hypothetical protein
MLKTGKVTWIISLAVNLAWVLIVFSSLGPHQLPVWFNSDTLYLPSLYRDLFVDNSGLRGWHLNGAPNFFPDMPLFFLFNLVAGDFRLAMLIFSISQYMALILLLNLLLKAVARDISWHLPAIANFLMLVILFVTVFTGDFVFTFYILSVGYHLGAFIMTILCLLFTLGYLRTGEKRYLILLMVFGFIAVLSNRIFIVMFVIPSVIVMLFFMALRDYRRMIKRFLSTVILFSAAGIIAFHLLSISRFIYFPAIEWKVFNFGNIWGSLDVMAGQHFRYLYLMDFRGITVLLSLVSFILMSIIAIILVRDVFRAKQKEMPVEAFYACFSTVFFIVVLFMPVINGSYVSWAMLRYNTFVFYLALFNYAFILHIVSSRAHAVKPVLTWMAVGISVLATLFTLHRAVQTDFGTGLSAMLGHYPGYVECIDEFAGNSGFQYGISDYWYAKTTTMFSRQGVRLYTVYRDMGVWAHGSNRNWYYKNGKGAHGNPEFRFVLMDSLHTSAVGSSLGEPLRVFNCEQGLTIYVYPEFLFDRTTRRSYFPGITDEARAGDD